MIELLQFVAVCRFKPSVALPISIKSMGSSADKKQGVTMGMDVLDCPVCYEPFKPPILQVHVLHIQVACS